MRHSVSMLVPAVAAWELSNFGLCCWWVRLSVVAVARSALVRGRPCGWAHTQPQSLPPWPLRSWELGWMRIEDVWRAQVTLSTWFLTATSAVSFHKGVTYSPTLGPFWEVHPHTLLQASMLLSPKHIPTKSQVLYHPAKSLATCLPKALSSSR